MTGKDRVGRRYSRDGREELEGGAPKKNSSRFPNADDQILERLQTVAHQDWKSSTPRHVSDQGVRADLERHHQEDILSQWRSHYREPD